LFHGIIFSSRNRCTLFIFLLAQQIDGRALCILAKEGLFAQLTACGLETVGDQLRLNEVTSQVPSSDTSVIFSGNKKPTISAIKAMSNLDQRIYKAK